MSNLFTLADHIANCENGKRVEADLKEVNRQLRRVELDFATK